MNETLESLKSAHDQGFLSTADFESKIALLTRVVDSGIVADVGQFIERAANSETANDITDGSKSLVREALKSEMAVDMATGAAAGAVIASVVPLIGTGAGAIAGAAFGAYKNFTKKKP